MSGGVNVLGKYPMREMPIYPWRRHMTILTKDWRRLEPNITAEEDCVKCMQRHHNCTSVISRIRTISMRLHSDIFLLPYISYTSRF